MEIIEIDSDSDDAISYGKLVQLLGPGRSGSSKNDMASLKSGSGSLMSVLESSNQSSITRLGPLTMRLKPSNPDNSLDLIEVESPIGSETNVTPFLIDKNAETDLQVSKKRTNGDDILQDKRLKSSQGYSSSVGKKSLMSLESPRPLGLVLDSTNEHPPLFVDSDPISNSSFIFPPSPTKPPIQHIDTRELEKINKVKYKHELLREMSIVIPSKAFKYFDEAELQDKFTETHYFKDEKRLKSPVTTPQKENATREDTKTTQIIKQDTDEPIIRWKRYMKGKYDETKDIFIPCTPFELQEKFHVRFYDMQEFVNTLYEVNGEQKLAADIRPGVMIILINYHKYMMNLKNQEERQYKSRVQDQLSKLPFGIIRGKQKTSQDIEYILDKFQYLHNVNVHPINSGPEMVDLLHGLTYMISSLLYDRYQRNPTLANLQKSKTGNDPKLIYMETLKNFKLMTTPKVEKLFLYYNSLYKIYAKFKGGKWLGNDDDGRRLVPELIEKAMNRFFTSNDENDVFYHQ